MQAQEGEIVSVLDELCLEVDVLEDLSGLAIPSHAAQGEDEPVGVGHPHVVVGAASQALCPCLSGPLEVIGE